MTVYQKLKKRLFPNHYAKLDAKQRVKGLFYRLYPDKIIHILNVISDEETRFIVRVFCRMSDDNNQILVRPPRAKCFVFSVPKNGADVEENHDESIGLRLGRKIGIVIGADPHDSKKLACLSCWRKQVCKKRPITWKKVHA